jgi:hypothetical protein
MVAEHPPPLSITWSGATRQELLVTIELARPASVEQLADLERAVAMFAALGSHGAFPRATASPTDSSMALTHADAHSPTRLAFVITAQQVDLRAFQLVRHVAWRWSARAQPVRAVAVLDRTEGHHARPIDVPDTTWGNEESVYPPLSQSLQVRVERDDPADYHKERRCVVEFGRRVPQYVFETVNEYIGGWVALVSRGAFAPPVRPAVEGEVWQTSLGPYDEYSAELALSLFEASELAWNPLVNCLQRYSQAVEPVVLVTIE